MTIIIYNTILLLGLILWIIGLIIIIKRNILIKYVIINTIIFTTYSILWFKYSKIIVGHDEYELGMLFGFPIILAIHSILVFIIIVTIKKTKHITKS
jgi:hypothetical protein